MSILTNFASLHPGWFTLLCILIGGLILLAGLIYYGFSEPPTPLEKAQAMPGDELLGTENNRMRGTLVVTVNAPPEKVWPYIAQLGQRRAGFYALDWLERLLSFHIYNTYQVIDEWQNVYNGEYIFYHQAGIGSEVKAFQKDRFLATLSDSRHPSSFQGSFALVPPFGLKYFAWSWNFILQEASPGRSRFFTRCDAVFEPFDGPRKAIVASVLGIPSFVMCKAMLKTIKACAEGRK